MKRDTKTARVIMVGLMMTNLGPRVVRAAQETIETFASLADLAGFTAKEPATTPLVEEKPGSKDKGIDPIPDPNDGDPSGGDPSGGDPSGGDPSGGDPSGGDPSGGDPSGGDPSGGDPSGGDPSGGDPSGGDPSGGDPSGGDPSGGDPSGAAPEFVTQGPFDTVEGQQNVQVADIDATDGDGGLFDENVTYEIEDIVGTTPNYPKPFEIDPDDGGLRATQDAFLDRDLSREFVVTIRAMDADGTTDKEYVIDVRRAIDPPGIPTPFGPDDEIVNTRNPTYSWSAMAGAKKYDIWTIDALETSVLRTFGQNKADCKFNPVCYATPNKELAQGMATWWVLARNNVGDSQWSDALSFSVEAAEPPDEPEMLGPTGVVQTAQPELKWTARATSSDYVVQVRYRDIQSNRKKTFEQYFAAGEVGCGNGAAECSLVMPFEIGDGTTKAKVKAVNAFGESRWSHKLDFEVLADKSLEGVAMLAGSSDEPALTAQWQTDDWLQWLSGLPDDPVTWDVQAALSAGCQISQTASGNASFVAMWDCATPIVFTVIDGNITWLQPAVGEHMSLTADAVVVVGDYRVEHLNRVDGSPMAPPLRLHVMALNVVSDRFGAAYVLDEFGISAVRPGRVNWTYMGSQPVSYGPVFGPEGNIYLGTVDGQIIALDRRGDELLVERAVSGPVVDIRFGGVGLLNVYDVQGKPYEVSLPDIEDDL